MGGRVCKFFQPRNDGFGFSLVLGRTRGGFCPGFQLGDMAGCHGKGKTFCLAGCSALFWLALLKSWKKKTKPTKIPLQGFHQRNWVPVSSSRELLFHHKLEAAFRELRTFLFSKGRRLEGDVPCSPQLSAPQASPAVSPWWWCEMMSSWNTGQPSAWSLPILEKPVVELPSNPAAQIFFLQIYFFFF